MPNWLSSQKTTRFVTWACYSSCFQTSLNCMLLSLPMELCGHRFKSHLEANYPLNLISYYANGHNNQLHWDNISCPWRLLSALRGCWWLCDQFLHHRNVHLFTPSITTSMYSEQLECRMCSIQSLVNLAADGLRRCPRCCRHCQPPLPCSPHHAASHHVIRRRHRCRHLHITQNLSPGPTSDQTFGDSMQVNKTLTLTMRLFFPLPRTLFLLVCLSVG